MANRIPKEIIEDILERVDIVQVIETHLPLKKSWQITTRDAVLFMTKKLHPFP